MMILLPFIAAAYVVQIIPVTYATRQDLVVGVNRLSSDVIALRNEIERSISNRCASIRGCYKSSYGECQSEYTTQQTCPSIDEIGFAISDCGSGKRCNGLFDKSITTVRIPATLATGENGNPTNPEVVEAICYTRTVQAWMVNKYNQDKEVWKSLGVDSPQMFFGSSTGVFRIFPARQSRECGLFDPRLRPWYQASLPSSISNTEVKPRNVVILIDNSRSMDDIMIQKTGETKLDFVKQSVTAVVSSLSERASIAVIRFGESSSMVGRAGSESPFLWQQATDSHKETLISAINDITVQGRSNWVSAFNFAFTVISNSLKHVKANDKNSCKLENIALLFFSDGDYNMPSGVTDDDIVKLVSDNKAEVEASGDYHVFPFLYSIGNTNVDQVSKQVSCATGGYWMPVTSDIAPGNVTQGYNSLFSTPMGTDAFYNYTSWSEPYNFATSGKLGYTVTGLAYNRDVQPPRYMGAVGMDISAEAARVLHEGTMEETVQAMSEIINNITESNFNTTCEQQRINLTDCETQSMRQLYGGNDAICLSDEEAAAAVEDILPDDTGDIIAELNNTGNITGDVTLNDTTVDESIKDNVVGEVNFGEVLNCSQSFLTPCPGKEEYPDDLWNNVLFQGNDYNERVCCEVGSNNVTDKCPYLDERSDTNLSEAAIFGILFASLVVVELIGCFICFYYKKKRSAEQDAE